MSKVKTVFVCQNCGATSPKWIGRCTNCGEWNTYTEEVQVRKVVSTLASRSSSGEQPRKLSDVSAGQIQRIDTRNAELNRVLGGGLVPGVAGADRRRTRYRQINPGIATGTGPGRSQNPLRIRRRKYSADQNPGQPPQEGKR
ncbi:MAG: hypothetical protein AB2L24_10210 [Mangrovibacterium sp.]